MALDGDRRAVLRWAMAAALAPALASRAGAVASADTPPIAPPAAPMVFTRRLQRGLGDGSSIVVVRDFAVGFAATPTGWSVAGEQIGVTVDAPPRIAALMALEQRRVETGLFPLALDRTGLIRGGPDPRQAQELDEAVAIALRQIRSAGMANDERQQIETLIRAVHEAGTKMSSQFPADLFAPRDDSVRAERELALPGGGEGTIEVRFTAVTDAATRLMREARREIVTSIGSDRRLTREDWTLALR